MHFSGIQASRDQHFHQLNLQLQVWKNSENSTEDDVPSEAQEPGARGVEAWGGAP